MIREDIKRKNSNPPRIPNNSPRPPQSQKVNYSSFIDEMNNFTVKISEDFLTV